MSLSSLRIVLVETQFPGNIGAAARAMHNFDATDLALVAPECDPLCQQARQMATHGEAILEQARRFESLQEAVADCVLVVGTTARTGGSFRRQSVGTPDQVLPHLCAALRSGQKAALVFGGETNGLSNEYVRLCHYGVRIPTSAESSSLNLAQAVGICLYEVHRLFSAPGEKEAQSDGPKAASFAEQDGMFQRLEAALRRLHFLYGEKAESLMHGLRHLLGRAVLTSHEVGLLEGLARQIDWHINQTAKDPEDSQRPE